MGKKHKVGATTRGPWRAKIFSTACEVASPSGPVANWQGFDDSDRPIEEHRANALLMAAAPDLLRCVEAMLEDYEDGKTPDFDLREECRRAKYKARGEKYE